MLSLPITLFCLQDPDNIYSNFKDIIVPQLNICQKGLSSFLNLDCSQILKKLSDFSLSEAHPIYDCELFLDLNPLDLIYLYNFRMFLYISASQERDKMSMTRVLFYPALNYSIQMISQPFKLVSTPLTHILTKRNTNSSGRNSSANSFMTTSNSSGRSKKSGMKFGFLTLDQNQRMCPLMASDPMALQVPLIGVWIFGVTYPKSNENEIKYMGENYLIWGILAEFVKNQQLMEKFAYDEKKKNFFLACFSLEENPKFYEVELLKGANENKWVLLKVEEEMCLGDDYQDLAFERNQQSEIIDMEEFFKGEHEEKIVFTNNNHTLSDISADWGKKKEQQTNKEDAKENYKATKKKPKLYVEDLINQNEINNFLPIPREIPKKEEFINYLSPRLGFELNENSSNARIMRNDFKKNIGEKNYYNENPIKNVENNAGDNSQTQWNAEKIFQEQAKQLKFLQDQVLSLQEALKQTQEIKKKSEINPIPIQPNFISNINNKILVNQSTNTTFFVDKNNPQSGLGQIIQNLNKFEKESIKLQMNESIPLEKSLQIDEKKSNLQENINKISQEIMCDFNEFNPNNQTTQINEDEINEIFKENLAEKKSFIKSENENHSKCNEIIKNEEKSDKTNEILETNKENLLLNSNLITKIDNSSHESPEQKKIKNKKPVYFMQMDFLNSLKKNIGDKEILKKEEKENDFFGNSNPKPKDELKSSLNIPKINYEQTNNYSDSSEDVLIKFLSKIFINF